MKIMMPMKELKKAVKGINKVFSSSKEQKVSKWIVSNEGLKIQVRSSTQLLQSLLRYTTTNGEEGVFYIPEFKFPSYLTSKKGIVEIDFLLKEIIFRYPGEPEYSIPANNIDINRIEKYFEVIDNVIQVEYSDQYMITLNPKLLLNLLESLKNENAVELVVDKKSSLNPIFLSNSRGTEKRVLMPMRLENKECHY